jgi:hypothetical protein
MDTPKGPGLVSEEGPDALQGDLGHFSMERIRWQRRPASWPSSERIALTHVTEGDEPLLTFVPQYQLHTPETLN